MTAISLQRIRLCLEFTHNSLFQMYLASNLFINTVLDTLAIKAKHTTIQWLSEAQGATQNPWVGSQLLKKKYMNYTFVFIGLIAQLLLLLFEEYPETTSIFYILFICYLLLGKSQVVYE